MDDKSFDRESLDIDRREFLARVAYLYHHEDHNQDEISELLGVSRSSVSRLLKEAREEGIIEILIHFPLAVSSELSQSIEERFGLDVVKVVKTEDIDSEVFRRQQVAKLAARYINSILNDNDVLAISWGRHLYEIAQQWEPTERSGLQVVQIAGTPYPSNSEFDGANLANQYGKILNAEVHNLNAPLIVESPRSKDILMEEPSIRKVLEIAKKAPVAVVGIGSVERFSTAAARTKILSPDDRLSLQEMKAAGDICSVWYDICGKVLSCDINDRIISLDLESLKKIPFVLGVTSGAHKAVGILGALRGRFVSGLITDDVAAKRVLELDKELAANC